MFDPTIKLIEKQCELEIKSLNESKKQLKQNEISKEEYEDKTAKLTPLISDYLTSISTLKIKAVEDDAELINSVF